MCRKLIYLNVSAVVFVLSMGFSVAHGQAGHPAEEFLGDGDGDSFDLAYSSVTFTPTSGGTSYTISRADITQLPTNPAGGINLGLTDDDFFRVPLSGQRQVRLFNNNFSAFYVGSNGYITFTQGDEDHSQTLAEHFEMLRISGLYCDLNAANEGMVTSKQLYNRVVITWQAVPEFSNTSPNTFQIEMFWDGKIRISWLEIGADDCIVGLSNGGGLPDGFVETDFSDLAVLLQASEPSPTDGTLHFATWATLCWRPGDTAVSHDVYFGNSYNGVNNGTGGTFRGNQVSTSFVVGLPGYDYQDGLVPGTTYYWRIDEVNDMHPDSPWKGSIWSFTAEEYVSVPILEEEQTLPRDEELALPTPEDLTVGGLASDLTLHFKGDPSGTADPIYVKVEDFTGAVATVIHPDHAVTQNGDLVVWRIPLSQFIGVDLTQVLEIRLSAGEGGEPSGGFGKVKIMLCQLDSGPPLATLNVYVRDATAAPLEGWIEGAFVSIIGEPIEGKIPHDCGNLKTNSSGRRPAASPYFGCTYIVTVTIDGNVKYSEPHTINVDPCNLVISLWPTQSYDHPAEEFLGDDDGDSFDLEYSSVTFTPTSDGTSYSVSCEDITQLPTNPAGGINRGLGDDNFSQVSLSDQKEVKLFNQSYQDFFVGSNGYITFINGDDDFSETLAEHFAMRRISGLYTDLTAANEGMVTSKQLADRVAITWQAVPEVSNTSPNTFQIEMFFDDGVIRLSWLEIGADKCIVGLSSGGGLPDGFVETDFR